MIFDEKLTYEVAKTWDEFLAKWPVERVRTMTLDEYSNPGTNESFTYWIEFGTMNLGSIRGGDSSKFGIYRRNSEPKDERSHIKHGEKHSWKRVLGDNEDQAFGTIKSQLIEVIEAVHRRDLDIIEQSPLPNTVKWKTAYLYQDRQEPCLLSIYKPSVLFAACGSEDMTVAQANRLLIQKMPEGMDISEYAYQVWHENQPQEDESITDLKERLQLEILEDVKEKKLLLLKNLAWMAHEAGLDIYPTAKPNQLKVGRKERSDQGRANGTFCIVNLAKSNIKIAMGKKRQDQVERREDLTLALIEELVEATDDFLAVYPVTRTALWPRDYLSLNDTDQQQAEKNMMSIQQSTNQILYGPPGTGKTYHTVEAAVRAAEPNFVWSSRKELKEKYDRLVADKRIRFVTFHQSYGYEEFVEGLKAITNEDNQIEYHVHSGVFKQICQDALASVSHHPSILKRDGRIWKLSIDGVKPSKARDYCFANNLAAIGWGDTGDMSLDEHTPQQIEYFENLGSLAKSSVMEFSGRMSEGDIVVCVKGQWSIQAVGVVSGDYQYREQGIEGRSDFCHIMPVKWLAKDIDVNLYGLNDNTRLTLKTCYELTRFNSTDLFELLKNEGVSLNNDEQLNKRFENYVLVIDEINRGNISKIFGELITLIEPSKRKGADECIELTLPQSNKIFAVPDNLHLIGTMNTADRSLALIDTALRRRFDFIEMMPKPELLAGCIVKGVDLEKLLSVLNQRIEILYDREHMLGHAFFMPIKKALEESGEQVAFSALVSVFQNKIIPLLEEYFFEDWEKIRLVLGDNQKEHVEHLQFIQKVELNSAVLRSLFGKNHSLEQYGRTQGQYSLVQFENSVWTTPDAYKAVYSVVDNNLI